MSRRTRKNVGVIGLGIIGGRVTSNLRKKGFHVFVWNRTPRPVPNFVGAPGEIAEMCDFIQIFVSDDDALLGVCKQLAPALAPRHVVIAHSTVAPHTMREAADVVERRGARFVEAPFTGSKKAAENGELVFYVGGDEVAIEEARPVLSASSKNIMMVGEIGQATAIKLATNMITAASVQAAAEALALVHTVGLPLEKLVEALEGNASHSKTLAMKLPKMIETNFEPHFSVKHMLKDIQIASRIGASYHLELGVTAATRDRLLEQMQHGFADEDYSAVARKYFAVVAPLEPVEPAPVLHQAAPAEQHAAPAEQHAAPAEQHAAPAEQHAAPAEQHAAPLQSLQPLIELLQQAQSGAVIPSVPETAAREPESHVQIASPVPEFTPIAPPPEDRQQKPEENKSAIGRTTPLDTTSETSAEEEEERRGFLSRLLRKQIDY